MNIYVKVCEFYVKVHEFVKLIYSIYGEQIDSFINYFWSYANIISRKYLLIILLIIVYLSYFSTTEKIVYSSFNSDNYNDYIISKISKFFIIQSKISLHIINNKVLHPITIFIQNL